MAARKRFRLNSDRLSKKPGLYPDGDGLYLSVRSKTAASWLFRYADGWKVSSNGKRYPHVREIGLGSYPEIKLARARELAADARGLRAEGIDPLAERKRLKAVQQEEEAKAFTFKDCAISYITGHKAGWKNEKHAAQWLSTLETYAFPIIGHLAVAAIDVALVTKVLEQQVEADRGYPAGRLWEARTETARRLRGRIESVLDWAAARGRRSRENPARWKGAQQSLLPRHTKVREVKHHPALPWAELPGFMARLRALKGVSPLALQFTILTAARTGEALEGRWAEFDLEKAVWTLPGSRMKSGREHKVPLSKAALAVLRKARELTDGQGFVFPGKKATKYLSNMAMLAVLKRMDRADLTVHGFRSTFRDWIEETTSYPGTVAEAALAHVVGDKVEAAYRRGDLFEKRCSLMTDWAAYCAAPAKGDGAKVVSIRRKARAA